MTDPWATPADAWATAQDASNRPQPNPPDVADVADLLLGTVAGILAETGDQHGVAVLLDSRLVVEEHGWDWDAYHFSATLLVPRHALPMLDEERRERIRQALNDARALEQNELRELYVRPLVEPASPRWREDLARNLDGQKPLNQARIGRAAPVMVLDGLGFRSGAEVSVYRALLRAADGMSPTDSIGVVPLAGFRTGTGNVWEPDFLVTFRGRVGAIEVDGPSHRKTHERDVSRDRLLRQSGVGHIDRFVVADTDSPATLDGLVRGFLQQLLRVR